MTQERRGQKTEVDGEVALSTCNSEPALALIEVCEEIQEAWGLPEVLNFCD
jgi:hypothetical protein